MFGGCSASAFAVQVLLQPRDQDGMASLGERGRRLPLPRGHDGDRGAFTLACFGALVIFWLLFLCPITVYPCKNLQIVVFSILQDLIFCLPFHHNLTLTNVLM